MGHKGVGLPSRALAVVGTVGMLLLMWVGGAQPWAQNLFPAGMDKVAHFTFYGGVALLVRGVLPKRWAFWSLPLTLLVGVADEWHQLYLPGRTASAADVLADFAGAWFALSIATFVADFRAVLWRTTPRL